MRRTFHWTARTRTIIYTGYPPINDASSILQYILWRRRTPSTSEKANILSLNAASWVLSLSDSKLRHWTSKWIMGLFHILHWFSRSQKASMQVCYKLNHFIIKLLIIKYRKWLCVAILRLDTSLDGQSRLRGFALIVPKFRPEAWSLLDSAEKHLDLKSRLAARRGLTTNGHCQQTWLDGHLGRPFHGDMIHLPWNTFEPLE